MRLFQLLVRFILCEIALTNISFASKVILISRLYKTLFMAYCYSLMTVVSTRLLVGKEKNDTWGLRAREFITVTSCRLYFGCHTTRLMFINVIAYDVTDTQANEILDV